MPVWMNVRVAVVGWRSERTRNPDHACLPKERMPVNLVVKSYAKAKSRYALSSINQHDR